MPGMDPHLTDKQREVLDLIAQGKSNQDISGLLYLSLSTVKNYVTQILMVLGVDNRTQAARLWWGLTAEPVPADPGTVDKVTATFAAMIGEAHRKGCEEGWDACVAAMALPDNPYR